jgi:hypothetical protein
VNSQSLDLVPIRWECKEGLLRCGEWGGRVEDEKTFCGDDCLGEMFSITLHHRVVGMLRVMLRMILGCRSLQRRFCVLFVFKDVMRIFDRHGNRGDNITQRCAVLNQRTQGTTSRTLSIEDYGALRCQSSDQGQVQEQDQE